MKNQCTNVRRPPGCHSDGPTKLNIAAVLAGATKKPVKKREFLKSAAVKKQLRIKN